MESTVLQTVLVQIQTLELLATSSTVVDLYLDLMENINWIQKMMNVEIMMVIFMDYQSLAPARTVAEEVTETQWLQNTIPAV